MIHGMTPGAAPSRDDETLGQVSASPQCVPVRIVLREVTYQSARFQVVRDLQELPDGSHHPWESVVFGGSVQVLPIDEAGYVYLIEQYRPLIERNSLEVVGGHLDDGEPAIETSHRELREEAGISARLIPLGTMELSTAAVRCQEHFFLAVIETIGEADPEVFERQTFRMMRRISIEDAVMLVMNQEIVALATVALILLAAEYSRRHGSLADVVAPSKAVEP